MIALRTGRRTNSVYWDLEAIVMELVTLPSKAFLTTPLSGSVEKVLKIPHVSALSKANKSLSSFQRPFN